MVSQIHPIVNLIFFNFKTFSPIVFTTRLFCCRTYRLYQVFQLQRYVALPKKMLRLKKKGYEFPELEAMGWLDGWEVSK